MKREDAADFTQAPGVAYGRLLESAHFSSYGFERLCDGLEWLLKEDRWRQLGDWDINEFLATIDLSSLNLGSKRPKLIKRIKELQPDASQRAIAKAVGVAQMTVSRDLGESSDSGNAAKRLKGKDQKSEADSNGSPPWLAQPASETADKLRTAAQATAEKERRRLDKEGRKSAVPDDLPLITDRYCLIHGDLEDADIKPGSVDCIVTDPPYSQEFIDCYATLARKAAEWLKPGGSLLAMSGQTYLPDVVAALKTGGLSYQWTLSYLTPGGQAAQIFPRRVNTFWKPVFWLVKGEYAGDWIGDVARSNPNDNDKRFHDWGQSESGMADLVSRFTDPGHVICDPFMGGATTGVVAIAMDRLFIGVEKDAEAFETARQRLGNGNAAMVA